MLSRAAVTIMTLVATLLLVGQPTTAQASSFSTWVDINYDFEVYWGTPETVYDLYVVHEDGSEKLVLRSTSSASISNQMRDFAEGRHDPRVVDWYVVKGRAVVRWNYFSTYDTSAVAYSNADWIESMGLETDVRMIYNPSYIRK